MKYESTEVKTIQLSSSGGSNYFIEKQIDRSEPSQDLIDDFESLEEKLQWTRFSSSLD